MQIQGPVSVAMATYNGQKYLSAQLRSLAEQNMLPAELVVCDDLSNDNTVSILKEFSRSAPFPVKIHVNHDRLYFSDNFLKSASLCNSRFIAFCDQDDIWLPERLEKTVGELETTGAMLCTHNIKLMDSDGNIFDTPVGSAESATFSGNQLSPWGVYLGFTCTIDARLLALIPSERRPSDLIEYDRKMAHDRWIHFLAASFGTVRYIGSVLSHYRQHESNVFGHRDHSILSQISKLRSQYASYIIQRHKISEESVEALQDISSAVSNDKQKEAIERWAALAGHYKSRSEIFYEKRTSKRIAKIFSNIYHRKYSSIPGGNRREIIEDIAAALIARPVAA